MSVELIERVYACCIAIEHNKGSFHRVEAIDKNDKFVAVQYFDSSGFQRVIVVDVFDCAQDIMNKLRTACTV